MAQTKAVQDHERRHLETPVARARKTDPQTSHDAAKSVGHISELKLEIMKAFLKKGSMRDDELVWYLRDDAFGPKLLKKESTIRSRRHELVEDDGLLEAMTHNGKPVQTEMNGGRSGQVWKLKT